MRPGDASEGHQDYLGEWDVRHGENTAVRPLSPDPTYRKCHHVRREVTVARVAWPKIIYSPVADGFVGIYRRWYSISKGQPGLDNSLTPRERATLAGANKCGGISCTWFIGLLVNTLARSL